MQWNSQQRAAIKKFIRWVKDKDADPVFRLFGWAGSGKTTLARHLEELVHDLLKIDKPTVYASYTGKAALVMQQKGCADASTIHRLIYKPIIDHSTGRVIGYSRFNDSPLTQALYGTFDEVSMVSNEQGEDLLAFGRKLLVLGDPFQLPPPDPKYGDEGFFMRGEPDVMLDKIERQALDNPIIHMATQVRMGKGLPYGRYGESRVLKPGSVDDEFYLNADQILCGKNDTRRELNAKIRTLKGMTSDLPQKGDKLICVKNDRELGLLNGGTFKVTKLLSSDAKKFAFAGRSLDIFDDEGKGIKLRCDVYRPQFDGTEKDIDPRKMKGYGQFDFGEAMTVHKGQGSQWRRVGIINEDHVFREHADRWAYTGLTRAVDSVQVVGRVV